MNRRRLLGVSALALTLGPVALWAQDSKKPFAPEQLDQMPAPVALYPDALLSQTLLAATYPLEVVEASRWTQANPNLEGDYLVNGRMIGGFGVIAWPVRYGDTGAMTFIVNQDGAVDQQDLGPQTAEKAGVIASFNPDAGWVKADMALP